MLEKPASNTQQVSPLLREVWAAWQITPHDAAWKRNLHAALTQIGGSVYELNNTFLIVRENLRREEEEAATKQHGISKT